MTDNAYHSAKCPHCLKHVTIRLRTGETYTGRCQCPHRQVSVQWQDGKPELTKAANDAR